MVCEFEVVVVEFELGVDSGVGIFVDLCVVGEVEF